MTDVVQYRTEALGRDHLHTADAEANLAFSLSAANRHDEAVPLFEHSSEVESRTRGHDAAWVLKMVASLGVSLEWLRRYEDEVNVLEAVIPRLERVLGPEDERTIAAWSE